MRAPKFMLAAGMLFWGVQAGQLIWAAPLALALEAAHWTESRWQIRPLGFQRVADFCTWIFFIGAAYLTFSMGLPVPVLNILQWLPVVLAPLLLAQLYSTAGRIELSALFLSLRGAQAARYGRMQVDLGLPFVVVCVLAAGSANARTWVYFLGLSALTAWVLWTVRPQRRRVTAWIGLVALALSIGYAGQIGLAQLQTVIVNYAVEYLNANLARTDPYRASTDIGHIGELKSSDRILLRVTLPQDRQTPVLLHRASYDSYLSGTWLAREAPLETMAAAGERALWVLDPVHAAQAAVVVRESMPYGRSVLSLPHGAVQISGLEDSEIKRNRLGTVQVDRAPGPATYTVRHSADAGLRDAPTAYDLRIPAAEQAMTARLVDELGLRDLPAATALDTLRAYFAQRFRYSTYQSHRAHTGTPLENFLLRTRSGHCEYFATATVLLARAAGIPARYATGYSVQEWSALQSTHVVRERHAHAWARVYVDGVWRDVDTTPPQWFADEAERASLWQPLGDLWSFLSWQVAAWRASDSERGLPAWALWSLVPLFAVLLWRVHRGGGFGRRREARSSRESTVVRPGTDSEFYRIEQRLAALDLGRAAHEPVSAWIDRLERMQPNLDLPGLRELLELHYRYRFDPQGIEAGERSRLASGVEEWLRVRTE